MTHFDLEHARPCRNLRIDERVRSRIESPADSRAGDGSGRGPLDTAICHLLDIHLTRRDLLRARPTRCSAATWQHDRHSGDQRNHPP